MFLLSILRKCPNACHLTTSFTCDLENFQVTYNVFVSNYTISKVHVM